MNWGTGLDINTRLWITKENLLCSTGNSTQPSVVSCMGRKSKKKRGDKCIQTAYSLCGTTETNKVTILQ